PLGSHHDAALAAKRATSASSTVLPCVRSILGALTPLLLPAGRFASRRPVRVCIRAFFPQCRFLGGHRLAASLLCLSRRRVFRSWRALCRNLAARRWPISTASKTWRGG